MHEQVEPKTKSALVMTLKSQRLLPPLECPHVCFLTRFLPHILFVHTVSRLHFRLCRLEMLNKYMCCRTQDTRKDMPNEFVRRVNDCLYFSKTTSLLLFYEIYFIGYIFNLPDFDNFVKFKTLILSREYYVHFNQI